MSGVTEKSIDEYFIVEDATVNEIHALAFSGANMDEVTDQLQEKAKIGPELIKYIARTKITA